jgi:proline dehydrogenase
MSAFDWLVTRSLPLVPKPIVWQFSKKYIAGPHLDDAVRVVKALEARGMKATLDVLGEHVSREEETRDYAEQYLSVLETISTTGLDANVSLKPTQMGLALSEDVCYENVSSIVSRAAELGNSVRLDMEDSPYTTATVELYRRLRQSFENVGLVLQAYLYRTLEDVRALAPLKPNYRLCKGIYVEPRSVAYQDREVVRSNFALVLDEMLARGSYVGIATHDEQLVWDGWRLVDKHGLRPDQYEFQMLLGVREDLRSAIVSRGHKLRVYVPFGRHWHAYSMRRLRENPAIARHIIRSLLGLDR